MRRNYPTCPKIHYKPYFNKYTGINKTYKNS